MDLFVPSLRRVAAVAWLFFTVGFLLHGRAEAAMRSMRAHQVLGRGLGRIPLQR